MNDNDYKKTMCVLNVDGTWSKLDLTITERGIFPFHAPLIPIIQATPMLLRLSPRLVTIAHNSKFTHVVETLPELTLNTRFCMLSGNEVALSPQGANLTLKWTVPSFLKLLLFLNLENKVLHLIVRHAQRYYRLPVPNQFDDGRLCCSIPSRTVEQNQGILKYFEEALKIFAISEWNADLFDGGKEARAKTMFKFLLPAGDFTPDQVKQVELTETELVPLLIPYSGDLNALLQEMGDAICQ